ncbi:MAG: hypothetical protein RR618_02345 [Cellulosilyticaceae bacterium]
MIRNISKVIILAIVSFGSLEIASGTINQLVTEVKAREETITDALIKKQVETAFKEVEKKIEEVAIEENIEIKTEKVEMKPPEVKKEEVKKEEPKEEIATGEGGTEEITTSEIEDILEVTEEGVEIAVDITADDIIYIGKYLVENYFLDGNRYYQSETDPIRYERKKLTHEMEVYVISSLSSLINIVMDMNQINEETIGLIIEDATVLSEEFSSKFKEVEMQGEVFAIIYEEVNSYFTEYLGTLKKMKVSLESIKTAPNPSLVIAIIMKDLNQVIIPGIKSVINTGLDLKNRTNAIYIEGVEGIKLLTSEEVIGIIKDPQSIMAKEEIPENPLETDLMKTEEIKEPQEQQEQQVNKKEEINEVETEELDSKEPPIIEEVLDGAESENE